MLVRPSFLDADTLAVIADPAAPLEIECADLRCEARVGTVALGFPTRCAHCGRLQRLPKPVLIGWTCAACVSCALDDAPRRLERRKNRLSRR